MPSKKKKYNARFPAGRIKKIMQSDEEVGKVAQAVPVIISRTLELFVESLLTKTLKITNSRNAKTLSTSHMKQCIMSEQRFDFLRELVRNIPDISVAEEAANYNDDDNQSSPEEQYPDSDTPYDLSMPSTSSLRGGGGGRQQQHQGLVVANGHNGGGHQQQHHHNYLKRSFSTTASSVIRHTTTALSQTSLECLPAKLTRSESTPTQAAAVPQSMTTTALVTPIVQQQHQQQHPRLKHQSYSMPPNLMQMDKSINNKPNTLTPPKQQTTAIIPAPIVNIDYTTKPVVKIDYSNLPIAAAGGPQLEAPLSAPANIACMSGGGGQSGFNFSAEPVINIDLTNIVASPQTATTKPTVATISIGSTTIQTTKFPSSPSSLQTSSNSSSLTKTKLTQSHNSKALMAEPYKSTTSSTSSVNAKATALAAAVAAASNMTTSTTTTATKNDSSSSYLDMDEDYDNI